LPINTQNEVSLRRFRLLDELEYLKSYPIRGFPAFESIDLAPKSATCFDIKPEMVQKISMFVFKTGLESLRSF